jgi:hypothetical protein
MRFIGRLIRRIMFLGILIGIGSAFVKFFKDPMRREQAASAASSAASRAGSTVRGLRGAEESTGTDDGEGAGADEPAGEDHEKPADT